MTREMLKTKLEMLNSLSAKMEAIRLSIITDVEETVEPDSLDLDPLWDTLDAVCDRELSPESAIVEIEDFFPDMEEGEPIIRPEISIDPKTLYLKVSQSVPGGKLCADFYESDYNTVQVGLYYEPQCKDTTELALALAEVKRGEFATLDGKSEDNKDVDLYIYSDPYTEDWQTRITYRREYVLDAIGSPDAKVS